MAVAFDDISEQSCLPKVMGPFRGCSDLPKIALCLETDANSACGWSDDLRINGMRECPAREIFRALDGKDQYMDGRMDDMTDPMHENETQAILDRVARRFSSLDEAAAWYHSEPLPGLSGRTAAELTAQGRAAEVLAYIDAVDAGLHA